MSNPALLTDRYEYSMLESFIAAGKADDKAVFEVFTRRLPDTYRYGVFAGLGRLLDALEAFNIEDVVETLCFAGVVSDDVLAWARGRTRTSLTIRSYAEGSIYFPHSPVLTVEGTLGEAVLIETLVLSILNFDSGIAAKASRIRAAAGSAPFLIEMGSRRTNEDAAVAAARAAYIGGFDVTSNLAAGAVHGIPTAGTAAHAYTLAFESEKEAFRNQIEVHGPGTTLLVDTYDVENGVRNAIEAANETEGFLGSVRIDSGDLAVNAQVAREILDEAGFHKTNIAVTSDLDEDVIKDLRYQQAPIDTYGVGTRLVAAPSAGFVYKLVAIESPDGTMRPVAKKSKDKMSVGGKKTPVREYNHDGILIGEYFTLDEPETVPDKYVIPSYVVFKEGAAIVRLHASGARRNHAQQCESLPQSERAVWSGHHGAYLHARQI